MIHWPLQVSRSHFEKRWSKAATGHGQGMNKMTLRHGTMTEAKSEAGFVGLCMCQSPPEWYLKSKTWILELEKLFIQMFKW